MTHSISSKFWVSCLLITIMVVALTFFLVLVLIGIGDRLIISQTGEKHYPKEFYTQKEYSLEEVKVEGTSLTKLWEITADTFIDRPPLYQNGNIVLQSDQMIWATDENGSKLWQHLAENEIQDIYVNKDTIVFDTFALQAPLIAISLYDGHLLWQSSDNPRDVANGPDDSIIVGWNKQNLYQSINTIDGEVNWQYKPINMDPRSLLVTVDIALGKVYLCNDESTIVLNDKTGAVEKLFLLSEFPFPSWATSGKLYIQETNPGKLIAIESNTNHILWETITPRYKNFPPIFSNNAIYLGDINGNLVAIDQSNGEILWKYPPQQGDIELVSNIVFANEKVYGIFSDARLIVFDAKSGQILGYIQFAGVSNTLQQVTIAGIATSEDKLFVSLGYKKLYAFRIQ